MSNERNDILNNRLIAIENLLSSAAALNGGFDKLMVEINCIRSTQEEIKETLSKITDTVYDPDVGLVIKAKETESKITEFDKFEEDLIPVIDRHREISLWMSTWERDANKFTDMIDRHKEMSMWITNSEKELARWSDKKTDLLIEIDRLTQWKNNVTKLLWIIGGSTAGLLAKNLLGLLTL